MKDLPTLVKAEKLLPIYEADNYRCISQGSIFLFLLMAIDRNIALFCSLILTKRKAIKIKSYFSW